MKPSHTYSISIPTATGIEVRITYTTGTALLSASALNAATREAAPMTPAAADIADAVASAWFMDPCSGRGEGGCLTYRPVPGWMDEGWIESFESVVECEWDWDESGDGGRKAIEDFYEGMKSMSAAIGEAKLHA